MVKSIELHNQTQEEQDYTFFMELPDYMSNKIVSPLFMTSWFTVKLAPNQEVSLVVTSETAIAGEIDQSPKPGVTLKCIKIEESWGTATWDYNMTTDGHPELKLTKETGEKDFMKIKTHTNVPSPNNKYMAGVGVDAEVLIIPGDGDRGFARGSVAMTILRQNSILQLKPNYQFYILNKKIADNTLVDHWEVTKSALAAKSGAKVVHTTRDGMRVEFTR